MKQLKKIPHAAKWVIVGLLFTVLWSSASTATKKGLLVAEPLTIAIARFALAGAIMLVVSHLILRYKLPKGRQWKIIGIYGLLNITIYLGLYVLAMQYVTAGIGALAVATNPLFIGVLSVLFLRKKITFKIVLALLLGIIGVFLAAYPLLKQSEVSYQGLFIMLLSMLSYSAASIYFNKQDFGDLKILTINGWQTLIGGLLLLPFMIWRYHGEHNQLNFTFWSATIWLAVFVSIFAIQCWLWLLKIDPVNAGMWLFLCPVFGFAIAALLVHDHIGLFTILGIIMVIISLMVSQVNKEEKEILKEEFPLTE